MKKFLMITMLTATLCTTLMANDIRKVDVVSCETDLKMGEYDSETKLILNIRGEDGNTFRNVYSKQQIQRSNKDYSYIQDNSNCIYLNEEDYKQVKDDESATFWICFTMLGIACIFIMYLFNN